jgi:hypothetical protein
MEEFRFDQELSTDDNIKSFYFYLQNIDPDLAEILKANIGKLIPLPPQGSKRSDARIAFNRAVIDALETGTPFPGTDQ